MTEIESCIKSLSSLQLKRIEKEKQFIRLHDKLDMQQSNAIIEDIKKRDNDINIIRRKITSLLLKRGDSHE